jgi:hypothetical protein
MVQLGDGGRERGLCGRTVFDPDRVVKVPVHFAALTAGLKLRISPDVLGFTEAMLSAGLELRIPATQR